MIYEFVRFVSGPYLRAAIDFYVDNQNIFNLFVVVGGFIWIYKNRNKKKPEQKGFFQF